MHPCVTLEVVDQASTSVPSTSPEAFLFEGHVVGSHVLLNLRQCWVTALLRASLCQRLRVTAHLRQHSLGRERDGSSLQWLHQHAHVHGGSDRHTCPVAPWGLGTPSFVPWAAHSGDRIPFWWWVRRRAPTAWSRGCGA